MIAMNCVIMFTDLHHFTMVSRQFGDRAFELIHEVYVLQGNAVVEAHGTIIKYIGDSLLAVFPEKSEVAAVQCALNMRRDFPELVDRWSISHETDLEVGLGWGRVVRGRLGHPSHMEDDIHGEEVWNTAAICHHRGVAVTEAMHDKVKDDFTFEQLPDREVKYRDEPLRSWAVVEG